MDSKWKQLAQQLDIATEAALNYLVIHQWEDAMWCYAIVAEARDTCFLYNKDDGLKCCDVCDALFDVMWMARHGIPTHL